MALPPRASSFRRVFPPSDRSGMVQVLSGSSDPIAGAVGPCCHKPVHLFHVLGRMRRICRAEIKDEKKEMRRRVFPGASPVPLAESFLMMLSRMCHHQRGCIQLQSCVSCRRSFVWGLHTLWAGGGLPSQ